MDSATLTKQVIIQNTKKITFHWLLSSSQETTSYNGHQFLSVTFPAFLCFSIWTFLFCSPRLFIMTLEGISENLMLFSHCCCTWIWIYVRKRHATWISVEKVFVDFLKRWCGYWIVNSLLGILIFFQKFVVPYINNRT